MYTFRPFPKLHTETHIMNIQNIRTLLDTVAVPNTARTLGGEKAVRSVEQRSDGIGVFIGVAVFGLDTQARRTCRCGRAAFDPAVGAAADFGTV